MGFFQFGIVGIFLYVSHFSSIEAVCPFILAGTPKASDVPDTTIPTPGNYSEALESLDVRAVFDDIYDVMANSNECFPADEFNGESSYAGLFLRLAWHCAGTFRATDGAGGCTGGRQRYFPEASWDDNVNLDKARALLAPIKFKYGDALSWGDLIMFAGNAAILNGNGPVINVCAGRIDERDGTNSLPLNTNETCDGNDRNCEPPLGASTVGLIYVNAQGVDGVPNPDLSAPRIREIFGRMGMGDLETVALIGGGHAFGKCHGACPEGPGPNPLEQPKNPWPGLCGNNLPEDTWTSGIEGQWTSYPFQWDNQYFQLLNNDVDKYELILGPGNAYQWNNTENGLLMLTTDIAFTRDTEYRKIVKRFAEDIQQLDFYFGLAWATLTTSGGQFASNSFCVPASELLNRRDMSCQDSKRTPFMRRFIRLCEIFGDYLNGICNDICTQDEFRFSDEYMCENCQDVFGEVCLQCQNEIGCTECDDGYTLGINQCGLQYCMPADPVNH